MLPRHPNFFIAGAPKAGTTSLYYYLDQHPQIYMSPIKEPCYFAAEVRPQNFSDDYRRQVARELESLGRYLAGPIVEKRPGGMIQYWDDYLKLFARAGSQNAVGEASVCYLWSPTAAMNIRTHVPDAKIIIVLRDPAERAFSQYMHGVSAGWIRRPFRDHIDANLRNRDKKFGMDYPFLELGLYYEQVKRYLELFPRSNLSIGFYEDYRARQRETLAGILQFLNVNSDFQPDVSARHLELPMPRHVNGGYFLKAAGIWQQARRLCPPALLPLARRLAHRSHRQMRMHPRDRAFLTGYYRDDIRKLADLLNRDLAAWLR